MLFKDTATTSKLERLLKKSRLFYEVGDTSWVKLIKSSLTKEFYERNNNQEGAATAHNSRPKTIK